MKEQDDMEAPAVDRAESSQGAGSKSWATKIRQKAKQLAKESEAIFMELGKLLYIIWDTPNDGTGNTDPLYVRWGYDNFAEYVEAELGMDRRRAQRLRKIWYALEVECQGIDDKLKENLVEMGSTKLRELARVISAENAKEWYDTCKDLNVNQITEVISDHVRKVESREKRFDETEGEEGPEQVQDPGDEENEDDGSLFNENFKLYPQQQRNLKDAIDAARVLAKNPKAKKGHCLDIICMDFIATNDIALKDPDKTREKFLQKMEKRLGIQLVAVEPKSGEIVHGLEVLEAIARRSDE